MSNRINLLAVLTIVGWTFFAASAIFVPIVSEFSFAGDYISELAIGRFGYVQTVAFFAAGLGSLAHALGISETTQGSWGSRAGFVMVGLFGINVLLAGIFPTDAIDAEGRVLSPTIVGTVHIVVSALAFLLIIAAMFLLSRTFKQNIAWRSFWPVSLVLAFAGEVVLGDTTHPPANATGENVVSFFEEYGTGSISGAYIQALAAMLLLWFVASVATALASWGQHTTAVLAAFGGTASVGVFMVYLILSSALAFSAASTGGLDAGAARTLYQARFMALVFYSFPVSVLVAATSVGALRTRLFPNWYGWFGIVAAAAFLIGGADVARSGFFAPDGDYGFILFWLFPVWLVLTSVVFMRRTGDPRPVDREAPGERAAPVG